MHNIGVIAGSGKERSTQSMSELLEKILDKKNMNEAYKKVCANKGAVTDTKIFESRSDDTGQIRKDRERNGTGRESVAAVVKYHAE